MEAAGSIPSASSSWRRAPTSAQSQTTGASSDDRWAEGLMLDDTNPTWAVSPHRRGGSDDRDRPAERLRRFDQCGQLFWR